MSFQKRTQTKKLSITIGFLLLGFLIKPSISFAQDLFPSMEVLPATTVEVGEEMYFSATGTTCSDSSIYLGKARYEWEFGDGYSCKFNSGVAGTEEYYYLMCQGIAVTHYFMKPGDYPVTLSVKVWEEYDDDGTPFSVLATSSDSVKIETGVKNFTVESGLGLIAGMPGTIMVDGNTSRFMRGTIVSYDNSSGALSVNVTSSSGSEIFDNWKMNWDTLPAHHETTTQTIHVTGEAPMEGFEIQRAPFHNRTAQYLYVQIPQAHRGTSTQLKVSLQGDTSGTTVLLAPKSNLSQEETILLNQEPLAQDNYVVIAELLDESNQRIAGGLWRDKFSKRYEGIPKVAIDENNSFLVDGELFFPIAPFLLDNSRMQTYIDQAGINTLDGEGYYSTHTPTTWADYLSRAQSLGLKAAGPLRGDYFIDFSPATANRWKYNHNPDRMAEYIGQSKDNPAVFSWNWQDEPNLGGWTEKIYPPILAAWAYVSHREDPHHLNFNSFVGSNWSRLYSSPDFFDYLKSDIFMGGKKWSQDVLSWDTYPITQRLASILNFEDAGPYSEYYNSVDKSIANNKNLLPWLPVLQPCKGLTISVVSEEQVYFETWNSVIHGGKGIIWFQYFDMDNTGRWTAMKKFADQMEVLTPVVLQADPEITVSDTSDEALNRVDTMIRQHEGATYIFTARVTEPDPITEQTYIDLGLPVGTLSLYTGVEPDSITTNFTLSDNSFNGSLYVMDENRTVTVTNGQFTDTFSKNDVHIYSTSPVSSSLQSDFDSDSDVDIFDYNILLANFGTTGDCENLADADGDCNVGIFDYNILIGEFGSGA